MSDRLPEPSDIDWVERAPAAAGVLLLPGLYLWHARGEWSMAIPAFLMAVALGLLGVGVHWLVLGRRRDGASLDAWFVSAALPITVASAAAVWITEGGLGWRTAVGSVTAGVAVSCWLLFVRIAARGLPDREASTERNTGDESPDA